MHGKLVPLLVLFGLFHCTVSILGFLTTPVQLFKNKLEETEAKYQELLQQINEKNRSLSKLTEELNTTQNQLMEIALKLDAENGTVHIRKVRQSTNITEEMFENNTISDLEFNNQQGFYGNPMLTSETENPLSETLSLRDLQYSNPRIIWTFGLIYLRPPTCPHSLKDAILVSVTFYTNMPLSNDPIYKTYQAYYCTKTEEIWEKPLGFYRTPVKVYTVTHGLARGRCQFMVKKHRTPEDEQEQRTEMTRSNDGGGHTSNTFNLGLYILRDPNPRNFSVINYTYKPTNVTVNIATGLLTSPGLDIDPKCVYADLNCSTNTGLLIWDVPQEQQNEDESCDYRVYKSSKCICTPTVLSCPDLGIMFLDHHKETDITTCGEMAGLARSLVESRWDLQTREFNSLDKEEKLMVHWDFGRLYQILKSRDEQEAFIKMYHIGACGFHPKDIVIDRK